MRRAAITWDPLKAACCISGYQEYRACVFGLEFPRLLQASLANRPTRVTRIPNIEHATPIRFDLPVAKYIPGEECLPARSSRPSLVRAKNRAIERQRVRWCVSEKARQLRVKLRDHRVIFAKSGMTKQTTQRESVSRPGTYQRELREKKRTSFAGVSTALRP